jgi:hypothetical protein
LNREKDSSDLKSGRPVVLENVKTDTAKFIDVGVEDLGKEPDLGRCHGVVVGEEELKVEDTAFVRRLSRAVDLNIEVSKVVLVRDGTDSWNTISRAVLGCDLRAQDRTLVSGTDNLRLGHEPFCLFNNTLRKSHFWNPDAS